MKKVLLFAMLLLPQKIIIKNPVQYPKCDNLRIIR